MDVTVLNPLSVSNVQPCDSGWMFVVKYNYPKEAPDTRYVPFKGGSFLDNVIHTKNENGKKVIECTYVFSKRFYEGEHESWMRAMKCRRRIASYIMPGIAR